MTRFEVAPWAPRLKVASFLAAAVCLILGATSWGVLPRGSRSLGAIGDFITFVPPLLVLGALLFLVRGYSLEGRTLAVQRLLWVTRVPLDGLQRAWHDPEAMQRSMRLMGNGGLFSVTGLFRNRSLGNYRAFVTRPDRAVVLRMPSRVVVISPMDPQAFLRAIAAAHPSAVLGKP